MTKQELQDEKQIIEKAIKDQELIIDASKTNIYWQKKRLKLVEEQLKSLPEEKQSA